MEVPSFEAFADFIRAWAQLHDDQEISPDTQFERIWATQEAKELT